MADKTKKIEEQLEVIEKRLANAQVYVAQNVNVEGSSFLHFGDWRGKSGHPLWMKNFMIPTTMKARARKEKALENLQSKAKARSVSNRRRHGAADKTRTRLGWRKAAQDMHRAGDDVLLIPDVFEEDVECEW